MTAPQQPEQPEHPQRFAAGVVVLLLAAICLFVAFLVDGLDIEFASVRPWLYLAGAVSLLVVLILAISLAPFGPDLIPKLKGRFEVLQDHFGRLYEVVLVLIGSGLVVGGTLYFFDYGNGAEDSPSAWWVVPVIVGVFVAVLGVGVRGHGSDCSCCEGDGDVCV
ncbi:MAG: hypothetical protein AAFZ07_12590 [Actinomycetota bacterium]